jgi:hypothetical protein
MKFMHGPLLVCSTTFWVNTREAHAKAGVRRHKDKQYGTKNFRAEFLSSRWANKTMNLC